MSSQSQVQPENTDGIADHPGKRLDISSLWGHTKWQTGKTKQQTWVHNSARSDNSIFLSSGLKNHRQRRRLDSWQFSKSKTMDTPHKNERLANGALSKLIEQVMHGRETNAESTQIIKDHPATQPDIVITSQGRSPVIIEAEYLPAHEVEKDAYRYFEEPGRNEVIGQPHPIEAAIALRYPANLAQAKKIDEVLKTTSQLEYCALYPNKGRFPTTGWLKGSVTDLADLIHLVDVPTSAFEKCAKDLENNIEEAVSHFPNEVKVVNEIFQRLGLTEDPKAKDLSELQRRKLKRTQTGRIAGAILANALLFHERIAAAYTHKRIPTISETGGRFAENRKDKALTAWADILEINYWPIFDAGSEIIRILPARQASEVLRILTAAAERIQEQGLLYENDLTGHVFQKLIVDRKYLAAFYTLPTSAALLANLAVAKMKDFDWSDQEAIGQLKIADFACGTGALLSAVYDQITNRYERTGGDPADLHQALMEDVFHGFDVVHYATCLTASVLSGKQPSITYDDTWFCTMPYGRQKDKTVKIGSLEFLDKAEQRIMFHTGDPAKSPSGKGEDRRRVEVLDNSMDLVIMNPPFRRTATKVQKDESARGPFAAFGSDEQTQKEMSERMSQLTKDTCYGFGGGIASAFAAIANKKLKPGGVFAIVLPMTIGAGSSWQKLRTLLAKDYEDVTVVSIAAAKGHDTAFSAFTGMSDCLVIARKKSASISSPVPTTATRFVSLLQRPAYLAAAGETAKQLTADKAIRELEDGPFGGDEVFCGDEKMGETISATVPKTNPTWNPVRIHDFSLPQTAYQLTQGKLWLPRRKAKPLAIAPLFKLGTHRPHHRIIVGPPNPAPFHHTKSLPKPTDTYPALWNHNAKKEIHLLCKPDSQLRAQKGQEERANALWHRIAGRAHLNAGFRINSQPLAVAFTEEDCIGGAWPNVNFAKKSWDYAFSIWGNCTLGLILFWWHANRQQPGRAIITVSTAKTLPVLDFRALSPAQIKQAKTIFDQFKDKHFLPAYVADKDETREELDRRVLCDWLGFDEKVWKAVRQLAHKWCAEPSVHGGKQRNKTP